MKHAGQEECVDGRHQRCKRARGLHPGSGVAAGVTRRLDGFERSDGTSVETATHAICGGQSHSAQGRAGPDQAPVGMDKNTGRSGIGRPADSRRSSYPESRGCQNSSIHSPRRTPCTRHLPTPPRRSLANAPVTVSATPSHGGPSEPPARPPGNAGTPTPRPSRSLRFAGGGSSPPEPRPPDPSPRLALWPSFLTR